MAPNQKSLLKTIIAAAVGCNCRRPKTSDAYQPIPKPKTVNSGKIDGRGGRSNSTVDDADTSAASFTEPNPGVSETDAPNPKFEDSVAVVKESDDPYRDFRDSIMEMVREKEMNSREELEELLHCFLELNWSCHHDVIIRAFTDVWIHLVLSGRLILNSTRQEHPGVSSSVGLNDCESDPT